MINISNKIIGLNSVDVNQFYSILDSSNYRNFFTRNANNDIIANVNSMIVEKHSGHEADLEDGKTYKLSLELPCFQNFNEWDILKSYKKTIAEFNIVENPASVGTLMLNGFNIINPYTEKVSAQIQRTNTKYQIISAPSFVNPHFNLSNVNSAYVVSEVKLKLDDRLPNKYNNEYVIEEL